MIRNRTTFVSRAVNNDFEQLVSDLLHNDLESKKPLFFEKTNSKHKLILPYANPLQHINHICQKSQSIHHISVIIYFTKTLMFSLSQSTEFNK